MVFKTVWFGIWVLRLGALVVTTSFWLDVGITILLVGRLVVGGWCNRRWRWSWRSGRAVCLLAIALLLICAFDAAKRSNVVWNVRFAVAAE
eukprot:7391089-Prymnesium_polylepis.1